MTKFDFLSALKERLSGLPEEEVSGRLEFYSEMIDDRIEEGLSEEEAVADIGTVEDVAAQIIAEIPLTRLVKAKIKPKKSLGPWAIALIVLGFPLWFSLLAAVFAVGLALYAVIWSLVVSLGAVCGAIIACAIAGILVGIVLIVKSSVLPGVALIGAAIFLRGLSVILFALTRAAVRGTVALTRTAILGIKRSILRKERRYE